MYVKTVHVFLMNLVREFFAKPASVSDKLLNFRYLKLLIKKCEIIFMSDRLKLALKVAAYKTGGLGIYHILRNRKTLTVAMFHRVLPMTDPRYAGADPEWTITPEVFRECMVFFLRHYKVLSPDAVFSALRGEATLPSRGLLITFDDGWADNAEYALPILKEFSLSSLIFVVGNAVNQQTPFWEERVYSFLATEPDALPKLKSALTERNIFISLTEPKELDERSIKKFITELKVCDRLMLESVLDDLVPARALPAGMMDTETLQSFRNASQNIGSHGLTHQPFTEASDIDSELSVSKKVLSNHLRGDAVDALSFPHGAYSETIFKKCQTAGYRYIFSSRSNLNDVNSIFNNKSPIGRIHISQRELKDQNGKFQPSLLATWLFLRPISKQTQMFR